MSWITPVTDRTFNDIVYLKAVVDRILTAGWDNATEADKVWWLTGSTDVFQLIGDTDTLITADPFNLTSVGEFQTIKGAWNANDINRVIGNTIYLRDLMNSYGYTTTFEDQTLVSTTDIPYFTSVASVYRANVQTLLNAFYTFDHPTILTTNTPNYVTANAIEISLNLLNTLLQNMIDEFKFCGTFYSADDITL